MLNNTIVTQAQQVVSFCWNYIMPKLIHCKADHIRKKIKTAFLMNNPIGYNNNYYQDRIFFFNFIIS